MKLSDILMHSGQPDEILAGTLLLAPVSPTENLEKYYYKSSNNVIIKLSVGETINTATINTLIFQTCQLNGGL